jgi:hypothetical protein
LDVQKHKENVRPAMDDLVRFKEMGNVTEIMWQSKRSSGCNIRKIDKDHYVEIKNGEYLEYEHIENRSQDLRGVAKSLEIGRDILNTNIDDVSKCRWVTLTYRQRKNESEEKIPMKDSKKLYSDFVNFNKRLRENIGSYEYITAAEPQGSGSWHLHVVMIFNGKAPYISNKDMSEAWKQGWVTVKRLDDVDNVGAYLTAYLGDMELNEYKQTNSQGDTRHEIKEVEYQDENGEKQIKKYVKGARLKFYPPQFHIFRWSKGIKKPIITLMIEKHAEKKVSADTLTFEKTITLSDSEKNFESTLNYRYYNSKRKKNQ